MTASLAGACGLAATAFAVATPLLAPLGRPGYRHVSQYISELGESGAPNAALVNLLGFLPTGALVVLFALLAAVGTRAGGRVRAGWLLFSLVGWAYVVAAFFSCDPGCPSEGSTAQQIHSSFGLLEYLGGGSGLLLIGGRWRGDAHAASGRRLSIACAVVVLGAFLGMLSPELQSVRGVLQRLAEAALFLWIAAVSLHWWRMDGTRGGV